MTGGHIIEPGNDALIDVPSGQRVSLLDVVRNEMGPAGLILRFRFLSPDIAREGGSTGYDAAAADIVHLCHSYALPRLDAFGPEPQQIVISLSDRPVPFGETMPEATQFFEAFSFADGTCIWEMF
jgi:hypothetical protein